MDPSDSVNHALAVLEQKRREKLALTKAQLGPLGQLALDLLERSRAVVDATGGGALMTKAQFAVLRIDAGGGLARALGGRLDNRMGECWTLRMGERTDLVLTVEQCIVVYDMAERSKGRDARVLREAIVQAGVANRLRTSGTIRVPSSSEASGVKVDPVCMSEPPLHPDMERWVQESLPPFEVVFKPRAVGPSVRTEQTLVESLCAVVASVPDAAKAEARHALGRLYFGDTFARWAAPPTAGLGVVGLLGRVDG